MNYECGKGLIVMSNKGKYHIIFTIFTTNISLLTQDSFHKDDYLSFTL